MRKRLLRFAFLAVCPLLAAQQAMNNDAVLKMVKAGLSDDIIVATINSTPGTYDKSADGLIALKQGGVSDKVITAIMMKASGPEPVSAAPSPAPTAASPAPAEAPVPDSAEPGTAVGSGKITAGSRVVIAPMGGFETYFAAAVRKKEVPITLTLDKGSAQFFVVSTDTDWQGFVYGSGGSASWTRSGGSASYGSAGSSTRGVEASIMLVSAKTKDVVWAYEVHKNSHGSLLFGTFGARGKQSVAEACAKHLKEYIEKGK